jgi:lysyl-tRNA synthetase class 2
MDIGVLEKRAKIIAQIRAFFDSRGFVEVETPVRIDAPAPEPNIDCPEVSPPRACGGRVTYLRASPELQMKKLLAAGMDRIYQVGPCFRDGEKGSRHNPEFTMIEWYRKDATYLDILQDTKSLYKTLFSQVQNFISDGDRPLENGVRLLESGKIREKYIDFKRITVREAYLGCAGWDPWVEWDQDRFDFDMATKIEPMLKSFGPVFLMDYPPQAASLAKISGGVAERWEFYVNGMELANCFTELCDPNEQRRRFSAAREERRRLDEADYPIDEEFLAALGEVRSAAGVALGVDRLVMTLLGANDIASVRV